LPNPTSDHVIYPDYFNKVDINYFNKWNANRQEWINSDIIRQTTNYFTEFKPIQAKSKMDALLKDKLLIKNIFYCITFNNRKLIKRSTVKNIRRAINKNKVLNLVRIILQRLLFRRILLWKDITRAIKKNLKFYLIGKNFKVYKKKIARTYVTQIKPYSLTY